ncbi:hypothetical protein [Saccharibacter floricola]|uniref:Uncharacterized protein n=1 Tax=Saccharibacter floricola DSM 15669 TaxID=1123227 RepID=A0ABQ0NZ63_9PROT|nr:hypothetical protein [Saccharibacter floricola]GBQ07144.1 hypothetical protein AA15669_1248 [Saccharibacter floricola DSM 15669]
MEPTFPLFFVILQWVAPLTVCVLAGLSGSICAQRKNRHVVLWAVLCFACPVIVMFLELLPPKNRTTNASQTTPRFPPLLEWIGVSVVCILTILLVISLLIACLIALSALLLKK